MCDQGGNEALASGCNSRVPTGLEGHPLPEPDHPEGLYSTPFQLRYLSHGRHQSRILLFQLLFIIRELNEYNCKDPESFLPDRWLDEDPYGELKTLNNFFMPFAMGKRNCVGQNLAKMELKLVLATLLRAFRFELQTEVSKDYFLTFKPVNAHFKVFKV